MLGFDWLLGLRRGKVEAEVVVVIGRCAVV